MNIPPRQLYRILIYRISEKNNQELQLTETLLKDKFDYYYIADSYDKEENKIDLENYVKIYTPLDDMTDEEVKKFNNQICEFIIENDIFSLDFLNIQKNKEHKFKINNII